MFGSKLRSWMEAVRPRKKQHRKDKQGKHSSNLTGPKSTVKWDSSCSKILNKDTANNDKRDILKGNPSKIQNQSQSNAGVTTTGHSRYSANNLSSPESAYSTGYSTDGTSPGAPPEYLLNSNKRTDQFSKESTPKKAQILNSPRGKLVSPSFSPNAARITNTPKTPVLKKQDAEESKMVSPSRRTIETVSGSASPSLGLTSPRQRNRIRTNPWLPGGVVSPSPVKHDINKTLTTSKSVKDSPRTQRFLSPVVNRRRHSTSSSCSSLSATSLYLEPHRPRSAASDDEDCTLHEMMGKYDESYIYEKETDILSDSDPTDCETDIDTGQDGGDEDDPFEGELDFIDNGSYLEFELKPDHNTGHCSYYNYEVQRKRSSRRRTARKSGKQSAERKRKSVMKKRHGLVSEKDNFPAHLEGSKSVGATPLSVRRASYRQVSKLALDECLKKRSNSISFYRDQITTIDKRDKEADIKYKELIVEAEQILRTMKSNGLSPRRLPGPANKRVELLRSAECAKPDVFVKNRPSLGEESPGGYSFSAKVPSNNYNCPRFSPKKNHITNFIISNLPVVVRKEREMQNQGFRSPLLSKKHDGAASVSPRYRRKFSKLQLSDSSSDSESERRNTRRSGSCPQSEPVRRKVYFGHANYNHKVGKTVAFNLNNEVKGGYGTNSTENLRQQVLLNTIVNLKRNLEDQSASLKQAYRSSQNIYV